MQCLCIRLYLMFRFQIGLLVEIEKHAESENSTDCYEIF